MLKRKTVVWMALIVVLLLGGYFRASGLFRGLEDGVVFHPDSPKQVMALQNYLAGNYVQYYDSLFYDGYPYGLNRVDEFLVRGWHTLSGSIKSVFYPNANNQVPLERHTLYYQARVLRVLYGMVVIGVLYLAAASLWGDWFGICSATLYAIAPLGATVTHSATGDVGIDLFLSILLWVGVAFVKSGHLRWFLAAGAACGMAFAAKYQGMLSLWIILVLAAASVWHHQRMVFSRLWKALGLGLLGGVCGILLLNPAFLIDRARTWRFMRHNFVFIKNYGVPEEFLDLPIYEKVMQGLQANLLATIGHLGVGLFVLALVFSVFVGSKAIEMWRNKVALEERALRELAFGGAMVSFTFGALFLATALKPRVQPFHFSFLLPPLAIVAAGALYMVRTRKRHLMTWCAVLVMLATACELWIGTIREDFFWRRPENARFAMRFSEIVTGNPNWGLERFREGTVRNIFFTEAAEKSVFRNRPSAMRPPSPWWNTHNALPYPLIPYPVDLHWIFMHGANYPRSPRMFSVPENQSANRTLVFRDQPEKLILGLQTGSLPSRYKISASGASGSKNGILMQHNHEILVLQDIQPSYKEKGPLAWQRAVGIDLQVQSELGPLWITVLTDEEDQKRFQFYGDSGHKLEPEKARSILAQDDVSSLSAALDAVRYYDSAVRKRLNQAFATLPDGDSLVLPAGAYFLDMQMHNAGPPVTTLVRLQQAGYSLHEKKKAFEVETGYTDLRWNFTKGYAPFDFDLEMATEGENVEILGWTLKPAPTKMALFEPIDQGANWPNDDQLSIYYPELGTLRGFAVDLRHGAPRYAVRFELDPHINWRDFENAVVFLHIKNTENEMLAGWDIALGTASFEENNVWWHSADALPKGDYVVDGGIYHIRNRIRYRFVEPEALEANMRRRYVRLGAFTVE